MPTPTTHPDADTLAAFGLGRLPTHQRTEVEAHVVDCRECCQALEQIAPDSLIGLARAAMMSTPGPAAPDTLPPDVPAALLEHPRYRVLNRIGAGGMGVVYKAEHRVMGRLVALKVLNTLTTASASSTERFRREVRLASQLNHPNIVTAYDADEAGGLHFLVMEYVDGVSLDRLITRKGPLPVAHACQYIKQAATGLQHAFEKGMVHRDIKPHNMMVTRKGQVKVLDFGLAQLAAPEQRSASITAPGMVVGTPDFMAPEQARTAESLDHRADIYSLGCTLFYLLTGRPPFLGTSAIDKLLAHVQDSPSSVSLVRPEVPADLAAVVAKMMAKKPSDRYQTPADVIAALTPFIKPGSAPIPVAEMVSGPVLTPVVTQIIAAEVIAPKRVPKDEGAPTTAVRKPTASSSTVRPIEPSEAISPSDVYGERPTRKKKGKKKRKSRSPLGGQWGVLIAAGLALVLVPLIVWGAYKALKPPTGESAKSSNDGGKTNQPAGIAAITPSGNEPFPESNSPAIKPVVAAAGLKDVLFVLPPRDLCHREFVEMYKVFQNGGFDVKTASLTRDAIEGIPPPDGPGGGPPRRGPFGGPGSGPRQGPGGGKPPGDKPPAVTAQFTLSQVKSEHLSSVAAVVFLGEGVDSYMPGKSGCTDVKRVIDAMNAKGRIVAALGHGMDVLDAHGYLKDKRAAGALSPTGEDVVQDGSLITGGDPQVSAITLAQTIVGAIKK